MCFHCFNASFFYFSPFFPTSSIAGLFDTYDICNALKHMYLSNCFLKGLKYLDVYIPMILNALYLLSSEKKGLAEMQTSGLSWKDIKR